jgi:hypothetical protein
VDPDEVRKRLANVVTDEHGNKELLTEWSSDDDIEQAARELTEA